MKKKAEKEVQTQEEEAVPVPMSSDPSGGVAEAVSSSLTALEKAVSFLREKKNNSKSVSLDHFVPVGSQSYVWPHISTGNIKIDYVIGEFSYCPGIPRGGISNIYGPEHSGKTTFALQVCSEAIRNGGCVCYIDFENILDTRYAKKLGIPVEDPKKFALYQPETLEQGVIAMMTMAQNGVDVVVFDSIGAAMPKDVMELTLSEFNEGKTGGIGLAARKWSGYLPRIQQILKQNNSSLIAISQLRASIGGMGHMPPEDTVQGGRGWKFYSILRVDLRPIMKIKSKGLNLIEGKEEDKFVGSKVQVTVKKCKVAPTQQRKVVVDCIPNKGFDPIRSLVDLAKNLKVVKVSGSWMSFMKNDGTEIKKGSSDAFIQELYSDPIAVEQIKKRSIATVIDATSEVDSAMEISKEETTEEFDEDDEEFTATKSQRKAGKVVSVEDGMIDKIGSKNGKEG